MFIVHIKHSQRTGLWNRLINTLQCIVFWDNYSKLLIVKVFGLEGPGENVGVHTKLNILVVYAQMSQPN